MLGLLPTLTEEKHSVDYFLPTPQPQLNLATSPQELINCNLSHASPASLEAQRAHGLMSRDETVLLKIIK